MTDIQKLVEFSRRYGSNPDCVCTGSGNTSLKENGVMYIKASGYELGKMTEEDLVKVDLNKLIPVMEKDYGDNVKIREKTFIDNCNEAKFPGQEDRKPSIEVILHSFFPQKYVLHLHPTLINGLTCGRDGKKVAAELFPDALWTPLLMPGYEVAAFLYGKIDANVNTVFLQNHGVFFAADTVDELDALFEDMQEKLRARIGAEIPEELDEIDLSNPFTPAHICYCGMGPELPDTEDARIHYREGQKIQWYTQFFGGQNPLDKEFIERFLM